MLVSIVLFAAFQGREIKSEDTGYFISFIFGVAIIPPIVSFYSHYFHLFPNYLQRRKILASVLVSGLLAVTATLTGFVFIALTNEETMGCVKMGLPYASSFTIGLSIFFGIIALILKGFGTWYKELKLKEELLEKTHRMEMALVKAQLDPHFLFNTLNNIDVLIDINPAKASQYLKKLSDIMRFMLYQTKDEKIPLTKELEYIEKYIELQKIRTSNPNYVQFKISGTPEEKKVAPMVFIPFIENAFKHSINKKIDHAVAIDIQIEDHSILFKCQNKFHPQQLSQNGENGLGNELIQKRLHLLYPEKHVLTTGRENGHYNVELELVWNSDFE